jgi:hypothetical protein
MWSDTNIEPNVRNLLCSALNICCVPPWTFAVFRHEHLLCSALNICCVPPWTFAVFRPEHLLCSATNICYVPPWTFAVFLREHLLCSAQNVCCVPPWTFAVFRREHLCSCLLPIICTFLSVCQQHSTLYCIGHLSAAQHTVLCTGHLTEESSAVLLRFQACEMSDSGTQMWTEWQWNTNVNWVTVEHKCELSDRGTQMWTEWQWNTNVNWVTVKHKCQVMQIQPSSNWNSKEQSHSWEADSSSASQVPCILWNTKGSLRYSQLPVTCSYPEPARSSPYPHIPLPVEPS